MSVKTKTVFCIVFMFIAYSVHLCICTALHVTSMCLGIRGAVILLSLKLDALNCFQK